MSMSIAELERTLAQLRLSGARDTLQTRLEQAHNVVLVGGPEYAT